MSSSDTYDAAFKALKMLKRLKKLEGTILVHEGILLDSDTLLRESQETAFVRELNALFAQYRNAGRPLSRALLGFDGGSVMIFQATPFTLCLFFGDVEETAKVEAAGEQFLTKWADSLGIEKPETQTREALDLEAAIAVGASNAGADDTEPVEVDVEPELPDSKDKSTDDQSTEDESNEEKATPETPASDDENPDETGGEETDSPDIESDNETMSDDPKESWEAYQQSVENLLSKVLGRAQARRFLKRELSAMGVSGDGYLKQAQFRPFGQKLTQRVKDKTVRKQLEVELLGIVEKHTQ